MKHHLVLRGALGKNTSRALQEAARCSCLGDVCLPGSSEVSSLFTGLVYGPWAGAQSRTNSVLPDLRAEHWWVMLC